MKKVPERISDDCIEIVEQMLMDGIPGYDPNPIQAVTSGSSGIFAGIDRATVDSNLLVGGALNHGITIHVVGAGKRRWLIVFVNTFDLPPGVEIGPGMDGLSE